MAKRRRKLSQGQLFAAIFFELSEAVGEHFSSSRLIEAASQLTKLIEKEFRAPDVRERAYVANYFSHETFVAMQSKSWQILAQETWCGHLDDEIVNPLFLQKRLRELGIFYD